MEENPWAITSIFQLQYFNCPSCDFRNQSKQSFVEHAFEIHPESIEFLIKISDGSLDDIDYRWNSRWDEKVELKPNDPEDETINSTQFDQRGSYTKLLRRS